MKAIAVGLIRPKATGSGERISVGVRSGSVRLLMGHVVSSWSLPPDTVVSRSPVQYHCCAIPSPRVPLVSVSVDPALLPTRRVTATSEPEPESRRP